MLGNYVSMIINNIDIVVIVQVNIKYINVGINVWNGLNNFWSWVEVIKFKIFILDEIIIILGS